MSLATANRDLLTTYGNPGADISTAGSTQEWLAKAGLGWKAEMAKISYRANGDVRMYDDRRIIFRNDTGFGLGVASPKFKLFQPEDIGTFFDDVCKNNGLTPDRAGFLKGGRVIFARAKVGKTLRIHGNDVVEGEINLATSFDGSIPTCFRFGTRRLVCKNGMTVGTDIVPVYRVSHRSIVSLEGAKVHLGLDGVFEKFQEQAERMADTTVTQRQAIAFFLDVYHSMKTEQLVDAQAEITKKTDATIARLAQHFIASPGADLPSAKGTVWGLLNAVTYDVDHVMSRRQTEDSHAFSALFGRGEELKNKAREIALELAA
jgi:phage/plasmid-like protein (TIGR03299 family)